LGLGTWDLGLGTWDLEFGIWYLLRLTTLPQKKIRDIPVLTRLSLVALVGKGSRVQRVNSPMCIKALAVLSFFRFYYNCRVNLRFSSCFSVCCIYVTELFFSLQPFVYLLTCCPCRPLCVILPAFLPEIPVQPDANVNQGEKKSGS
jgi:hypothetical protein